MDTDTRDRQNANNGSHDNVDLLPHEQAAFDQLQADYQNPNDQADLQDREANPNSGGDSNWADNTKKQPGDGNKGFFRLNRRRKGIIGAVVGFGVLGGVFGGFLGPATMFTSLMQNATLKNDASSSVFERRAVKVFGELFKGSGEDLVCGKKTKLSCKKGRLSNKALRQLNRKGITAHGSDGKPLKTKVTDRYPGKKVGYYEIDMGRGQTVRKAPGEMASFLREPENKKVASKIFGRGSPFNPRVTTKVGKYISKKFYNKFGIKGKGGMFDSTKQRYNNAKERMAAAREKFKSKVPKLNSFDKLDVKRLTKGRASKSIAYTIAFSSCVAVKAGSFVASAVAAAELVRLLPVISETILEPGAKITASGVDTEHSVSPEEVEMAGALLTEKTPNSEGKMTSALDSKYLQAALGVNKNPVNPSERYTPGLAILNNPVFNELKEAEKASEGACDFILSPMGYATINTAEAIITRANPIVGGLSMVGGFLAFKAAEQVLDKLIKWTGEKIVNFFVSADFLPEAKGEDLGDALGIAAMAYFSSEDMSHNLNALEKDQLSSFNKIRQENEEFQRQMDIASLSPFDTSSPYTFLGNIVNRLQVASITSGSYSNNFFQSLVQLARLPLRTLSIANTSASAADFDEAYCSHGDDDVARNAALLPCHGIIEAQDVISTNNAMFYLHQAGWIDMEGEFDDDATLDELVSEDIIAEDSPLDAFLNGETCDDASTGEYLFGAAGCTVQIDAKSGSFNLSDQEISQLCTSTGGEGENIDDCAGKSNNIKFNKSLDDESKAFLAMSVFAMDFQLINAINGTAADTGGSAESESTSDPNDVSSAISTDGEWADPAPNYNGVGHNFGAPVSYNSGYKRPDGRWGHNGLDMNGTQKPEALYAACSGAIKQYTKHPQLAPGEHTTANTIVIDCGDGLTMGYHHATLSPSQSVGGAVKAGDRIGTSDLSGNTTGYHVHFSVKYNGTFTNPSKFFKDRGITLTK